jgi:hypothetical protein
MEDNQDQEEAEKIFQRFKIKNDKMCCPDASELDEMIPCVKRLLQLFPEVKEHTTCYVFR